MSPRPLGLSLLFCLAVSVGASSAAGDDRAAAGEPRDRLAPLHALLKTERDTLRGAALTLNQNQAPAGSGLSTSLSSLPTRLEEYRRVHAALGAGPEVVQAIGQVRSELDAAGKLRDAHAREPSAPNAAALSGGLVRTADALSRLLERSETKFPALARPARPAGIDAEGSEKRVDGSRVRVGALACGGAFDGNCGARNAQENPRGEGMGTLGPGGRGATPTTGDQGSIRPAPPASGSQTPPPVLAAAGPAGATGGPGRGRLLTASTSKVAANPRLDRTAVPQPAAQPAPPKAEGLSALSPAAAACLRSVEGHDSIAELCKKGGWTTTLAPVLAGVVDALHEQFGTLGGWLMNIGFMLFGLVAAVATGGVGLVLKLLGLVFVGWVLWQALRALGSAVKDAWKAAEGSPERAAALRRIGMAGGGLVIMILMALIGWGAGKSAKANPSGMLARSGAAIENGMRAGLTKAGLGRFVDPANTLPAPVLAVMAKIFGGRKAAPEAGPGAAAAERAAVKPIAGENAAALPKAPSGEPKVLGVQEARALINQTDVKVKARIVQIKEQMKAKGLELSLEQERGIYMTRFYRELNPAKGVAGRSQGRGGIVMLDTNTGLTVDPKLANGGVVIDHHGAPSRRRRQDGGALRPRASHERGLGLRAARPQPHPGAPAILGRPVPRRPGRAAWPLLAEVS